MLFFMILNFSVSIVGALYIYPLGIEEGGTKIETMNDYDVEKSKQEGLTLNSLLSVFAGPVLMTITVSVMTAATISYFTRVPTVAAVAYGIFGGLFWGFFTSAFDIFFKIADFSKIDGEANIGITAIIWVFGIIVFIVFLAGFMQMISGGWKAIE